MSKAKCIQCGNVKPTSKMYEEFQSAFLFGSGHNAWRCIECPRQPGSLITGIISFSIGIAILIGMILWIGGMI